MSASALKINGDAIHTPKGKEPYETPRPLETAEVAAVVEDYRLAAERAKAAGFDGVEIHAANGYLIDQFLQSKTNQRTDRYGGSLENRFRFLKEIVEAIRTVWPSGRIGVRLSPNGNFNDMGSADFRETFPYAAGQLHTFALAYLHVVDGLAFGFHQLGQPMTLSEFRAAFGGPLIGCCGYTQETAEAAPEVSAHEPASALISGDGGIADLRAIVLGAAKYMAPGGLLALETGITHHAELAQLAASNGFPRVESRQDLTRRDRFLLAWSAL